MTELDLRQSLIPMQLIEHLASIMPEDASGEGYDYDAFLDVLVNGGAKDSTSGTDSRTGVAHTTKDSSAHNNDEGKSASRNGKENEVRDGAGSTSNVSALAVAEAEEWGSNGGMARRSRHYL